MRFKSLDELKNTKVGALPINQSVFAVAPIKAHQPERHPLSTLVQSKTSHRSFKTGVALCITIVSFRHKRLDDDNLCASAKGLRDNIAASIGVDDADPRLTWQYRQVLTQGAEGTLVEISTLKP